MLVSKIREIEELLSKGQTVNKVIISSDKKIPKDLYDLIKATKTPIYRMPEEIFNAKFKQSSGIVGIVEEVEFSDIRDLIVKPENGFLRLLLIDEVEDPHNIGAMMRSCACFGFSGVIMTSRRTSIIGEGVIKSSAGAVFRQKIARVNNLTETIEKLKKEDIWLVGTDPHGGVPIWEVDYKRNIGIVMGNEEKGVRKKVLEHCDYVAKIPIVEGEDSLNVSVAFGIIAFEAFKHQNFS